MTTRERFRTGYRMGYCLPACLPSQEVCQRGITLTVFVEELTITNHPHTATAWRDLWHDGHAVVNFYSTNIQCFSFPHDSIPARIIGIAP